MTQTDDTFKVLLRKDIYEFLQGNGPMLIKHNGVDFGMPYYTANQLADICVSFGFTDYPTGSRWCYIEGLMKYAIEYNRCNELLCYFFNEERFDHLREIGTIDEIDSVYHSIVSAAIEYINELIKLSRHELVYLSGQFYVVPTGRAPVIESPKLQILGLPYVRGLQERCKNDFLTGNYDSVITKSRTLMEEILVNILEKNNCPSIPKGDILRLYNGVKNLYGMQQSKEYDSRVNNLLSGLEKIVQSIAEMRNANSDAHGVGSSRIAIREHEARLIMNSAISFCEYILSVCKVES